MTADLQSLKEIIAKANPSLEDVERVAQMALDDNCTIWLHSRLPRFLEICDAYSMEKRMKCWDAGVKQDGKWIHRVKVCEERNEV